MKTIPAKKYCKRLASFTLVELLVVMGIISILAVAVLWAGQTAFHMAKQAKANNLANQIQTASLAYYTEYSVYPVPGGTTTDANSYIGDTSTSATAWENLICSLCGNIQPYNGTTYTAVAATPTNSRGIAFLTMKSSDVDANNAPLNPIPTGTEIYFNIAMDADYDGMLSTASPSSLTVMPNFAAASGNPTSLSLTGGSSTAGVAVWANCTGTTSKTNASWWVHTY
jgi:prepilin-type N-terminal cleavage/methylation domain-containing protein